MHQDGTGVVVDGFNQIVGRRDHDLFAITIDEEEHVGRLVINAGDFADEAELHVMELIADVAELFFSGSVVILSLLLGEAAAVEIQGLATEWLGLFLCVDVLKGEEHGGVGAEAVVLDEERYIDTIELADEVRTLLHVVKDGIRDRNLHLALEAVQLGDIADFYKL